MVRAAYVRPSGHFGASSHGLQPRARAKNVRSAALPDPSRAVRQSPRERFARSRPVRGWSRKC